MKYFQSLDNPNNKKFVEAFKKKYGENAVIGDVTQAAYLGPWLWKLRSRRRGASTSTRSWRLLRASSSRTRRKATCASTNNHHLWSKLRIGQWQADGQVKVSLRVRPDRAESVPEGLSIG